MRRITWPSRATGCITKSISNDSLEGSLYDLTSVRADTGSFQGGDNSIVFDWKQNNKLAYLGTMDEGKVEFWVKLRDDMSQMGQPGLNNKVVIGPAREDFATKVSSKLDLVQKGFYNDEIFGNSGPNPPRVGSRTTYTINWQIKNYYSDVKGVIAKVVLGAQTDFLSDKVFPEDQMSKLTYDSATRELTWNVGDMAAGQGALTNPPNVSFQVAFNPSEAQANAKATIVGPVSVQASDSWTDSELNSNSAAVETSSLADGSASGGQGIVQPR
ncbi:MAG: hypothetical protein MUD10_02450 [Candidatus Pacebacteria bacterium]|nr:hypothetical protein [Candidatus Paceibacterota bacterium]